MQHNFITYASEKSSTFLVFLLVWLLSSCQTPPGAESATIIKTRETVSRGNNRFRKAIQNQNPTQIAALYTSQARFSAPNQGFVVGRSHLEAWWKKQMNDVLDLRKQSLTVNGNEFMIYETGLAYWKVRSHLSLRKWQVTTYLQVWRVQSDGTFLLDAEVWNVHKTPLIDENKISRF
ncbi:MAG TPA: hypothetical protein DIW24_00705 [Bacteroidetes bacterium]|nr:hypothetical protein [Bacteroidota bacterium]HRR07371.1 hypothetical protein [Rhodothermales bacterium]